MMYRKAEQPRVGAFAEIRKNFVSSWSSHCLSHWPLYLRNSVYAEELPAMYTKQLLSMT